MPNEQDSTAVVRNYVDAFNRGDLKALKALLTDDAEIQGGSRAAGEPGIRPLKPGGLASRCRSNHARPQRVLADRVRICLDAGRFPDDSTNAGFLTDTCCISICGSSAPATW